MSLFIFITENCKADAATHGLTHDVERFKEDVERSQSTSLFDPFPPPYMVKKKLGGRQGRLIADRRIIEDHAVIVFLAVLIRGSRAYEDEFVKNPVKYGEQHFSHLITDEELVAYVKERTRVEPAEKKVSPDELEYGFLYGAFSHHQETSADDLVYETKEWVQQVSEEKIQKHLTRICSSCLESLSKTSGLCRIPVQYKQGWSIWTWRGERRLLLISIATDSNSEQSEKYAKKIEQTLKGKELTGILNASRRVYPALILADEDLWIDLEKEPVANMALSPEESEVLARARGTDRPFPLFINGRAGSGKSTILQYLFSDLLFYYFTQVDQVSIAPPIYLTANGELLRIARNFVERLLRSEAAFTQSTEIDLNEDHDDILNSAFCVFQPYLLSLIPIKDRNKLFAPKSRVDYARFRNMWIERFSKEQQALRSFGPDLSWHVIRSYIKGMSSETYLEPDDYTQLPENQITVTHETFKLIYDRVWSAWYERELDAKGLWDDQDLARYILENDLAQPNHPAVFCDEAQDFTRIELELLLRINLFSNRTLAPNDISRVPFAFAGDQFQTLNPTGFRWDAIKASFVEKFIFELDPARRSGRTDLNYHELKYNYRSTDKIVRFGNEVQSLRAALFGISGLKPQIPWAPEPGAFPVVSFRSNNGEFWKKFREQPGFVIIVPCGEGEEPEYVKSDPVLKEHIKTEDGVPLNVLSAARAKGCEYPAVIVYGFGAAAEVDVIQELSNLADGSPVADADKSLPIQYFINRVYVAVSRAKRRLIVVDTEEGFKKLWRCSQDDSFERLLLDIIKKGPEIWASDIEGMIEGNPDDLTKEDAGDPLENAKAFEMEGIARKDAFLLKQAALAYRSAGDTAKEKECRARSLEADTNYYEAGEAYFDAGFAREGVQCLWRAGRKGWEALTEKLNRHPDIGRDIEYQWSKGIITKANSEEIMRLLALFNTRLDEPTFKAGCLGDTIWQKALESVLNAFIDSPDELRKYALPLATQLDSIRDKAVDVPYTKSAKIYFSAERFKDALVLWDLAGATKSQEYLKAKALIEPYPQQILSLSKLGLMDEVIDAFNATPNVLLTTEQVDTVVGAFCFKNQLEKAFDITSSIGTSEKMMDIALQYFNQGDNESSSKAVIESYKIAVKNKQWNYVLKMLESKKVPIPEWNGKKYQQFIRSQVDKINIIIVRSLARSQDLNTASEDIQKRISAFLRNYLRVKGGSWKTHISIAEAGAAFERAGRFTDANSFYEAVLTDSSSGRDEQKFARQRLLISKHRQMNHEQEFGDKKSDNLERIERENQVLMRNLGIKNIEEIDHYPVLSPMDSEPEQEHILIEKKKTKVDRKHKDMHEVQTVDNCEVSLGCFRIEVSRKHNRINITNKDTMEMACIFANEGKCTGEANFQEANTNLWSSDKWNMMVQFQETQGGGISINSTEFGVSLLVQI